MASQSIHRNCALLLGVSALVVGGRARAQEVITLQPTPGHLWRTSSQDGSCVMQRSFGPPDRPLIVTLSSAGSLGAFEVILSGPQFRNLPTNATGLISVDGIDPGEPIPIKWSERSSSFASQVTVALGTRGTEWLQPLSPAAAIDITIADRKIRLAGGGFGAALRWAGQCLDNLWRSDGADPAVIRSAVTLASPLDGQASWITTDDYPSAAIVMGAQGTSVVRMRISAEGRPASCRGVRSSGTIMLDQRTCRLLMQRARYSPARDASGNAIETVVSQTVVYSIYRP